MINNLDMILKEQMDNFLSKKLGVEREMLSSLKKTIDSPQVVVITGLRRVGKSTLLAQIAKKFLKDNFYFVNFEDERLLNFNVLDFDYLHETLISVFGEKKIFLFDEIQNVPQWERFVRRLHDDGYKFIITGSNASLLSQELGTRLTGRSIRVELFPFSFSEFLDFEKFKINKLRNLTTNQRGKIRKIANEYLFKGGIPDALKYPELAIHKTLYDDVLYRDIATRYKLENTKSLKELAFYLASNISSLMSYNKIKELLKVGSVNTVKSYIDYLENSWLFFAMNKYAYSIKEQQIAAKKIYGIDTGLVHTIGFSFSKNIGKLMENAVYLDLKRKNLKVFYYKTIDSYEVDFYLPDNKILIQVSSDLHNDSLRERELRALESAASEIKDIKKCLVITNSQKEIIKLNGLDIELIPLYEWLLTNGDRI